MHKSKLSINLNHKKKRLRKIYELDWGPMRVLMSVLETWNKSMHKSKLSTNLNHKKKCLRKVYELDWGKRWALSHNTQGKNSTVIRVYNEFKESQPKCTSNIQIPLFSDISYLQLQHLILASEVAIGITTKNITYNWSFQKKL